ncbi:MAG: hypothetical protein HONBIEJF_01104 [Fimbriimonadaceae bacterium]|nr:hypothetical protein [Fimbriimonadaceae bacterium]
MSDFASAWALCRSRFVDAVDGLSQAQLNWRMHPGTLTIGEMAFHVAGAEVNFAAQLTESALDPYLERLSHAATDRIVNEKPFPFSEAETTPEAIREALERSKGVMGPLIERPTGEILRKEIVSVLGPVITGEGAFARMAFHAAYHQGQVHFMRTAPGFPPN